MIITLYNIVTGFVKSKHFSGHELAKKKFMNKYKEKLGIRAGTVYSAAIKSTETNWIGVVRNVQIL